MVNMIQEEHPKTKQEAILGTILTDHSFAR